MDQETRTTVRQIIGQISQRNGKYHLTKKHIQHGRTSVYQHSINVARFSVGLAAFLHIRVNRRRLIRGALLHDYFLYDWHEKNAGHSLHGFRHPYLALDNARRDFRLNAVERDIIKKHMFPLTPFPPMYAESWVVCLADKICSLYETLYMEDLRLAAGQIFYTRGR